MNSAGSSADGSAAVIALPLMMIIMLAAYFLPTLIAVLRRHPQALPIGLLNLLLGWTVLGWIGALIWSATAFTPLRRADDRAV